MHTDISDGQVHVVHSLVPRLFYVGGEKKSLVYTVYACAKYSLFIQT